MRRAVLLMVMILGWAGGAWGQTPSPAPATPDVKATPVDAAAQENPAHQELRDLRTRMQGAMNSGDIEALLTGVTDDVVFSTMNGDVVRGKDGIREYFNKMMSGPDAVVSKVSTNFEAADLTILYGGSLGEPETAGVAWGKSNDSYTLRDGLAFQVEPNWTATMVREPDGWKVASFHYSVSMFDNPILNKLKGSLTTALGGAGLGSLVIGFLLGYFLGSRRKKAR